MKLRLSHLAPLALASACLAPAATSDAQLEPQVVEAEKPASACAFDIAEGEAWINLMPGRPGRGPREVNVSVRLQQPAATAILLRSPRSTADSLMLEVRAAAAAPIPGRIGYRENAPDPLYQRVVFLCGGSDIYTIAPIQRVY
jgi:hypothetical protein